MKDTGRWRGLRLSSFFILLTVRVTGLHSNHWSISLHQHCPSRHQGHHREWPTQKPLQILYMHSKQGSSSQQCALPQGADTAQPLHSRLEVYFTATLMMSACSANSVLHLPTNSPSRSLCQLANLQVYSWLSSLFGTTGRRIKTEKVQKLQLYIFTCTIVQVKVMLSKIYWNIICKLYLNIYCEVRLLY